MKGSATKKFSRYAKFDKIDGSHPFRDSFENGYVDYKVRTRHGGKVAYFNFALAKEMGLIEKDHPHRLNAALQEKILHTFAIQIINEYDIENNVPIAEKDVRPKPFFATRYLQMQHPNKKGTTSGDGRGIWNGTIKHAGKRWDITSCGTGATKLSPATVLEGRYFETGNPEVSYGCGYANIVDGLAAAMFSEILHNNGLSTERTLALIEYENDVSINVRAGTNLLRPSHIFRLVKQGDRDGLKKAVDYWIDREIENGHSPRKSSRSKQYEYQLQRTCEIFAKAAARYESDYLFVWMDWDGDNILTDGGIIDYGSVRQFGLFHKDYRYDDDGRWSTNLLEQKQKARYTVQTFCQIFEFIKTKRKPALRELAKHSINKAFDKAFEKEKLIQLGLHMGLSAQDSEWMVVNHKKKMKSLLKNIRYFERITCKKGSYNTGDGTTRDPVFSMRTLFRMLPSKLREDGRYSDAEFVKAFKSGHASRKDLALTTSRSKKISQLHDNYHNICKTISQKRKTSITKLLLELSFRCSILHKAERITGNSVVFITEELMEMRKKLTPRQWQKTIEDFIEFQKLIPDSTPPKKISPHLDAVIEIAHTYSESI